MNGAIRVQVRRKGYKYDSDIPVSKHEKIYL